MVAARRRRDAVHLDEVDVVADANDEHLDAALTRPLRLRRRPLRLDVWVTVRGNDADVWDSLAIAVAGSEDGWIEKLEGCLSVGVTSTFTER